MDLPPRLFRHVAFGGVVWADQEAVARGDYSWIAALYFQTGRLEILPTCPAELRAAIEADAANHRAMRGADLIVPQESI